MRSSLAFAFLVGTLSGTGALAAEQTGAASPIGTSFCGPVGEAETPILRCPGPAGIDAFLYLGGDGPAISLGDPVDGFVTLGKGSTLGTTMEWRSDDGRPFAGIVRFRVVMPEGATGDVFTIIKVAEKGRTGCLAALVDGTVNPEARDLARRTADSVGPSFGCGVDEPRFYGFSSQWAQRLVLP